MNLRELMLVVLVQSEPQAEPFRETSEGEPYRNGTFLLVGTTVVVRTNGDLARSAGIEPTTPGFGGQYSIH